MDIFCWAQLLMGVCRRLLSLIPEGSICLPGVAVSQTSVNLPSDLSVALTTALWVDL